MKENGMQRRRFFQDLRTGFNTLDDFFLTASAKKELENAIFHAIYPEKNR